MNSLIGKSTGIALLMAAALLAALFAMGVFAPMAAQAGVVGGGAKPKVDLSTNIPDQDDVTFTAYFTVNDEVDGDTNNDVYISNLQGFSDNLAAANYPASSGGLTDTGVTFSVTQNGSAVGTVRMSADGQIHIAVHPTDTTKNLKAGVQAKLVIEGMNTSAGPTGEVWFRQASQAAARLAEADQSVAITLHAAVTSAAVELVDADTSDEIGPNDTEASVNLEITFETDADGAAASDATTDVVVTLPEDYTLNTDGDSDFDSNDTVTIEIEGTDLTPNDSEVDFSVTVASNSISIWDFEADEEVTVTINGLSNPQSSEALDITFKLGTLPADDAATTDVDEGIEQIVTLYVTDEDRISLAREGEESTLAPAVAGHSPATLTVRFESIVDVAGDTKILVALNEDFSGLSTSNVTVMQAGEEVSSVEKADYTNSFYIVEDDGADANNVEAGEDITVIITGLTNPSDDGATHLVSVKQGGFAAVGAMINLAQAPQEPEVELSSSTPGAAVQITVKGNTAEPIEPNEDITIDLSAFSVPSTIADAAIDITSEGFSGNPTNVLVSGKKVTMTVPSVKADGTDQDQDVDGNYSIRIKQSAGVENPASAGSKTIEWQENAPDGDEKEFDVTIDRVISLSKTSGTRGTESTATFKGFANDTLTVDLNGTKLAEVTVVDNVGTLELDTSSSRYMANQDNVITAVDAAGNRQTGKGAVFNIDEKLVVDPDATVVSRSVELQLSDWPTNRTITAVTIGSTDISGFGSPNTGSDGKVNFSVTIPDDVNRGSQAVKVTGGDASATATLSVGVLALSVEPDTVVPGQEITIQGSGFQDGDDLTSLTIGGKNVPIPSNNDEASSNGDIVITVRVPSRPGDAIGDGSKKIVVEADQSGRVAEGSITIPEASITLSPTESRRGTTVSVTGSGFPTGDLVQVQYDNDGTFVTVTAKAADSAGNVEIDFVVPGYADIGSEHEVRAASVGVYAEVTANAKHSTPGAVVTLSPERVPNGTRMTITGQNFPAFATVAEMTVGGVDVRPVPAPATSIDGDFSATVLVPQMELGNQSVSVRVAQTTFTTFVQIVPVTEVVVTNPAEVFAEIGDRLSRVWYLERQTQEWSFYDPDPEVADFNNLTSVSSGQVVQIIISDGEPVAFQGMTLYAGTNPISLR